MINTAWVRRTANADDKIWDEYQLEFTACAAFYLVQATCDSKDMKEPTYFATTGFLQSTLPDFADFDVTNNVAKLASIDVTETTVICCRDYINNHQNAFVCYLKGKINGYLVSMDRSGNK